MGNAANDLNAATLTARKRFYTVWAVIGGILLLCGFFYLLTLIPVPVGIIIWSTIIIFCLRTPVNFFERHGMNRIAGTALAYVIMVIVLAAVTLLLFSPVFGFGDQFRNLVESIPGYIQQISQFANGLYDQYSDILQNDTIVNAMNSVFASLGEWASQLASQSAGTIASVGSTIANSLLAIGFAFVVAFWILIELPGLGREVYRIADEKFHDDLKVFHLSFTRIMGGYIKATLLQCALIGVLCGILFAVTGIPNAAALGAITGILNIIPIVGPWFGGALAALVGVLINPIIGIIAFIGTICLQQFVYTFISPKIMQESVDIHPAITLVVMMIGSALGGIMAGLMGSLVGMLFSIPLVAVAKSLFVYYFEKRSGRRIVAEDGVFFRGAPEDAEEVSPLRDATFTYVNPRGSSDGKKVRSALKPKGFGQKRHPETIYAGTALGEEDGIPTARRDSATDGQSADAADADIMEGNDPHSEDGSE